jgi:hypothetical protein
VNRQPNTVVFDIDSVSQVGDLKITTMDSAESSVEIRSSINPRIDGDNPTNPFGAIEINSPNVIIGAEASQVSIVTTGDNDGGSITISNVNEQGEPTSGGDVRLIGDVIFDTTNKGLSEGADVRLVTDLGQVSAVDGEIASSLLVDAGAGNVTLGEFVQGDEINNLTIADANDVTLDDVNVNGNTVDITARGNVLVTGVITDAVGNISIAAEGNVVITEASAGADLSLSSATGEVVASGPVAGDNVTVAAETSIVLGGNTTATGIVTLVSNNSITTEQEITAAEVSVLAVGNIDLNVPDVGATADGDAIANSPDVTVGDVKITSTSGDINTSGITGSGSVSIISTEGTISQVKDTAIVSTGSTDPNDGVNPADGVILSAKEGIAIASIDAAQDVVLVLTKSQDELETDEPVPTFSRVNDPIALGQGESAPDIKSSGGSIVFLAPIADVGSADVGQNFVQRAGDGIFYGLEEGQFFSDDIGSTAISATIPAGASENLNLAATAATTVSQDIDPAAIPVIPAINIEAFKANLSVATTSTASAGETSASSSSRSTAASQRDDEEKVDEVDEVAFQNLKNYDENQQGIRLPDDQTFAYDDEGNIYFIVTLANPKAKGGFERITLYSLELIADAGSRVDDEFSVAVGSEENAFSPSFYELPTKVVGGEE